MRKTASGAKRLARRTLAEGLHLPNDPSAFIAFRDARTGLESLRSCREIWERGLQVELGAYEGHVYWEFREIHDGSAGQWARLAQQLGHRAVPSLEEALREVQLEPVHAPFRAIFRDGMVAAVLDRAAEPAQLDELETRFAAFLAAVAAATGVDGEPAAVAAETRRRTEIAFDGPDVPDARADRAALLGWLALSRTGSLAGSPDVAATSRAWYDEMRLPGPLDRRPPPGGAR